MNPTPPFLIFDRIDHMTLLPWALVVFISSALLSAEVVGPHDSWQGESTADVTESEAKDLFVNEIDRNKDGRANAEEILNFMSEIGGEDFDSLQEQMTARDELLRTAATLTGSPIASDKSITGGVLKEIIKNAGGCHPHCLVISSLTALLAYSSHLQLTVWIQKKSWIGCDTGCI